MVGAIRKIFRSLKIFVFAIFVRNQVHTYKIKPETYVVSITNILVKPATTIYEIATRKMYERKQNFLLWRGKI